ncbi:MAG: DUF917 family protein [Spirochaetes bacterium]|nr:DUF917 family protein [Spirochaetota bacterium]
MRRYGSKDIAFPITEETIDSIVVGGCFLGGGGGGSMEAGRKLGRLALEVGIPEVILPDALPQDSIVVTVSAVGAPAAKDQFCTPMDYVRTVELLSQRGVHVCALNTSENGGLASVNGWFQSAVLGIPVVDAPCNGRAHPMGTMGSMGLHRKEGYLSVQAACGGNPSKGLYTELVVTASILEASRLVRQASISAGGMVAVARNPVQMEYVKKNGAPSALSQALEVGRRIQKGRTVSPQKAAWEAVDFLEGKIVGEGIVQELKLETKEGFDVGFALVQTDRSRLEITFWNEFMTLEQDGERLGTFPDLIALMDLSTGLPLPSADLRKGQKVTVVLVPKRRLILGSGVKDPELLKEAEKVVGKPGGWVC